VKPVTEMTWEELWNNAFNSKAGQDEIMARLRERDAAKEWGERYPASVGGGDGNRLLAAMLASRKPQG